MTATKRREAKRRCLDHVELLNTAQRAIYDRCLASYMHGLKAAEPTLAAMEGAYSRAMNDMSLLENAISKAEQHNMPWRTGNRLNVVVQDPDGRYSVYGRYMALPGDHIVWPQEEVVSA